MYIYIQVNHPHDSFATLQFNASVLTTMLKKNTTKVTEVWADFYGCLLTCQGWKRLTIKLNKPKKSFVMTSELNRNSKVITKLVVV